MSLKALVFISVGGAFHRVANANRSRSNHQPRQPYNQTLLDFVATPAQSAKTMKGPPTLIGRAYHSSVLFRYAIIVWLLAFGAYAQITNPPTFLWHPSNKVAAVGQSVSFIAQATGSPAPTLEWRFNGLPLPQGGWSTQNNNGTSMLNIYDAQTNDAGYYALVASNTAGCATSHVAILTVQETPLIFNSPADQTLPDGRAACFYSYAYGTEPLHYQWYFKNTPLPDSLGILCFTAFQTNAGEYQCVVTNLFGSATASMTLTVTSAPTTPGALDVSFHPMPDLFTIIAMAVQPDGKIIVASELGYSKVIRLFSDGSVDPSFQTANADGEVRAVTLAPNGQILVGGWFETISGISNRSLARLNSDGTVDTTFRAVWSYNQEPQVHAIGIQSNGRILASGTRLPFEDSALLIVFEPDGTVARDALPPSEHGGTTCGTCGLINVLGLRSDDSFVANFRGFSSFNMFGLHTGTTNFGSITALHPLDDGRVLVCFGYRADTVIYAGFEGILRLLPDGSIDSTFSPEARTNGCYGRLAVQSDGKIIAMAPSPVVGRGKLVRLLPDGQPDPSFDTLGGFQGNVAALGIAKDGGILVAGQFEMDGSPHVSLARLHNDATESPLIGLPPTNTTVVAGSDASLTMLTPCASCAIQWQKDGANLSGATSGTLFLRRVSDNAAGVYQVIVSNNLLSVTSAPVTLTVLANNQPGSPDLSFNSGTGPDGPIQLMVRLGDGRLLVGGEFRTYDGVERPGLARLDFNGRIDDSFDAHLDKPGIFALTETPTGAIYIAGAFTNVKGTLRRGLARLLPDGALDIAFAPDDAINPALITTLAVQSNGRLLVGGTFLPTATYAAGLAVLNADGSINADFQYKDYLSSPMLMSIRVISEQDDASILIGGDGGLDLLRPNGSRITGYPVGPTNWTVRGIARTPEGRLFVAGNRLQPPYRAVAEVVDGKEAIEFAPPELARFSGDAVRSIALDACGHLVVGGVPYLAANGHGGVVKLRADGQFDTNFPAFHLDQLASRALSLPDNTVLLAGQFTRVNGVYMPGIARIKAPIPAPVLRDIYYTSRSVTAGRALSLSAVFDECEAPSVQWFQNGAPLPGGTNLILDLPSPQPGMSGDYTIVARNASGAVTSSPVNITVTRSSIAPGRLDTDFQSPTALLLTNVTAMAVREDGKAVLAGLRSNALFFGEARIIQVNQDGSLDRTFTTWNAFPFDARIHAVCTTRTGELIADSSGHFGTAIRRFTTTGEPIQQPSPPPWPWSAGASIAMLDREGRLVLVSAAGTELTRIDTNGYPEAGLRLVADSGGIAAVVQQDDGRWLLGGGFSNINNWAQNRITRVFENGLVDPAFNVGAGPDGMVKAIALQPGGRIIAGGTFTNFSGEPRARIAALRSDGSLDATFSTNAVANSNVNAVAVQPDGKIIVAGNFSTIDGVVRRGIARLLLNGELDLTFDPGLGIIGSPEKLVLDRHGRIYVLGSFTSYDGWPRPGIARVHGDVMLAGAAGSGTVKIRALTASGWNYILEQSATAAQPSWTPLLSVPGDGTVRSITNSSTAPAAFYRLRVE